MHRLISSLGCLQNIYPIVCAMAEELKNLMEKLQGGVFFELLKDNGFTIESLRHLKPNHLDTLIDKSLFGQRVIFERNLLKWQAEDEGGTTETHCLSEPTPPASSFNSGVRSFYDKSIEDILNETASGKQILMFYENKQNLTPKYRKLLSATVTSYLIDAKICARPYAFDLLSCKIVKYFTKETQETYYLAVKGKKPGGCLYAKYHSCLSKLRADGIILKKRALEESLETNEPNYALPDGKESNDQVWLKYNIEPYDEVVQKWETTFAVRHSFMKNAENLNSILEEWPLYKQSFGYSLIELDFQKLYPERTNLLFDKWSRFHQSIPFLFDTHIKDANNLHIWKRLIEGIFTSDVKDCVVLYLLHSVLVPTGRQYKICPQSQKKVIIKPTMSDSRNSFLIFACTQINRKEDTYDIPWAYLLCI
ncbi:uncharacterized protein [Eurosta solidaginis]|uniref:uncharacterized protein isoform X2 n=1 Tax=Eurosta solidaginis TaxID=178769 RepID=UPI003530FFAE